MLTLPYKRKQGDRVLRNVHREIKCHLTEMRKVQVIYTVAKFGTKFNIEYVTKKEHQHNLIYGENVLQKFVTKVTMVKLEEGWLSVSVTIVTEIKTPSRKYHPTVKLQDFEVLSKALR